MRKQRLNTLLTEAGEGLSGTPWNVYPRPQLVRDSFFCLNGEWDFYEYEGAKKETITVPFPPESILSGINRRLGKDPKPVYRKEFSLPYDFIKERVLLHFGAVDQYAEVFVNGVRVGSHEVGYEAFYFDVTEHLKELNTVEVRVRDLLHDKRLPYGKQREDRGGMWYTPVTGIWQTVWLESVPENRIERISPYVKNNEVFLYFSGADNGTVTLDCNGKAYKIIDGCAHIIFDEPRFWSPEDPYLYYFTVKTESDEVRSYFALRTLSIGAVDGVQRILLNGKPYYFHGVLDQGYFSDGIFTPASEKEYENDILAMKRLGFNTLRKHIKVEPEQFYYDCDRLGMIVFQDMVNNGSYSFIRDTALPTVGMKKFPDRFLHRNKASRKAFSDGMERTVKQLFAHPCICYWTIFNEGWGQFESQKMRELMKTLDTSRIVDTASGWFEGAESDVTSTHIYFKPVKLKPSDKPIIISEFGGYVYKDVEHSFNPDKTYGYKIFEKQEDFEDAFEKLYLTEIVPNIEKGLCGSIYTQLSDVEDETNGLLTYDRKVLKVDEARMLNIAKLLKI